MDESRLAAHTGMPLLGQQDKREMVAFVKKQLKSRTKIPWEYTEYGRIAAAEMFYDRETIPSKRRL